MEARDKLIKLNKKRQRVGHNSTACVTTLDSGYDLEDTIKVNMVNSKAAVVNFLTLGQKIKNVLTMCPYLTTMANFLTLG